jgi:2-(1,2-epoxy-1,2-dihydrophenyl)acetyl-CoA isomerase
VDITKFENIVFSKEGTVAKIVLNRPERLNAINRAMEQELTESLADIHNDEDLKVLVLTGAGRAFCSGGDVSENMVEEYGGSVQKVSDTFHHVYQGIILQLFNLDMPTIGMINGTAVGLGFDLALACDIRIGSEDAKFMVAFTKMGLTPAAGGAWLLPRVMGLTKANELIYTADLVEAEEALRLGILNRLVPSASLEKETMALAQKISQNSPVANRLAKLQIHRGLDTDLGTALELGATCQAICLTSKDSREALVAFREKRKPVFKGE